MLAALAHRGPDGAAMMADGPAALGHALLATTPEALTEPMPLRHVPTGCVITADVRLDNRTELMAAMGIEAEGRVIGDGELILLAYLRWGMECPTRLVGDFTFALWDPRHQRMFCARDKVGMRQMAYCHQPGKLFVCATDPETLLTHREVPRRINEGRVADFIEHLEAIDHVSTFFESVLRLPPAHALVVEGGTLRQWRYWELTPSPIIHRASDADYDAAFMEVFTEAVRARLRAPAGVLGSMLSGGMDSGSVVAIAARLLQQSGAPPLSTFSGIDDNPSCKESACIRDAAGHIAHISPNLISVADADSFREALIRLTVEESDPFDGHMTLIRVIYHAARQAGMKVMLDGVSGDTTLGTGDIVAYHLQNGRPRTAWAEARGMEQMWGKEAPALRAFTKAVRRRFAPGWIRARRYAAWQAAEAARDAAESLVSDALAVQVDMPSRRRAFAQHVALGSGSDQASQVQRVLHPYAIAGRQRYDRVAGALGIEPRDPFLDVRLLEFVVSLPIEQLNGKSWPKLILRRAVGTMLPESVRWKRGRDHVGWRFTEVCMVNRLRELGLADANPSQVQSYLKATSERSETALRCNNDRVVREMNLLYLNFWIARVNQPRIL